MSVTYCTLASLAAGLILHLIHRKLKHVRARAKLLAAGQSLTSGLGQLSVLSYNMLTDAPGRAKTLRAVSPEALDWSHRWRLLSTQISGSDADIICLQEVSMHSWQELVDLLSSRGYHPVLHTRSAAQPPDSCSSVLAVFYKDAKFALEWTQEAQHGLLVCLQHRDDAPCQEPSASSLRSSDYLHVVNVHLEASPLLPGSRLHQLKAILGLLSEKLGSRKAAAAAQLVLAGDLGSTRQASPCAFLSSGRVDAHWTEAGLPKVGLNRESLEHAFPLQEAYQAGQRLPQGKAQVPYRDTDFIWCSRGGRVVAVLDPMPAGLRHGAPHASLPNSTVPSDHTPRGAILQM